MLLRKTYKGRQMASQLHFLDLRRTLQVPSVWVVQRIGSCSSNCLCSSLVPKFIFCWMFGGIQSPFQVWFEGTLRLGKLARNIAAPYMYKKITMKYNASLPVSGRKQYISSQTG